MNIPIKGIPVNYEIIGEGIPLLTLHGWGIDHRTMKGCLEPVFLGYKEKYKRIYFDLPGMGYTPGAPWITNSDTVLEIVEEFIRRIIPHENYLLAGLSYGGYLARGLLKKQPQRILGLLLICSLYRPWPDGADNGEVAELTVFEQDKNLLRELSEEDKKYFQDVHAIQTRNTWERFSKEVLPGIKIADHDFLDNCLGKNAPSFSFDPDILEFPFEKPGLLLFGRNDSFVGYTGLWNVMDNFPRSSYVVIDGCGHNLAIEQEKIFNCLVLNWIDRARPKEEC